VGCPVCGCTIDRTNDEDAHLVTCACCDAVWLADDGVLDRILVGCED
jgi:hypothetical protein